MNEQPPEPRAVSYVAHEDVPAVPPHDTAALEPDASLETAVALEPDVSIQVQDNAELIRSERP